MANEKRLDLIDRQAFIEDIKTEIVNLRLNGMKGTPRPCGELSAFIDRIEAQPGVDAVEVVHGYWIDSYSADHMGRIIEHSIDCSVCDSVFKDDSREVVKRWKERFKICPFCGAKMDGGNEDG